MVPMSKRQYNNRKAYGFDPFFYEICFSAMLVYRTVERINDA